jgi:transposase
MVDQLEFTLDSICVIHHVCPNWREPVATYHCPGAGAKRDDRARIAGTSLPAHDHVAKFSDHLPLYRQSVI